MSSSHKMFMDTGLPDDLEGFCGPAFSYKEIILFALSQPLQ